MKRLAAAAVIFMLPLAAAGEDFSRYCPLEPGLSWEYAFYSKKEARQKEDIKTLIKGAEQYGNTRCSVYEIPSRSMYYYAYTDENGAWLKGAKVPMPLLGFLSVDILFEPGVRLLKFPFVRGEEWEYRGRAKATVFGFISVTQDVRGRFMNLGREVISYGAGKTGAYRIKGTSSRRWETEDSVSAECLVVKDIGLVIGETKNSRLDLKSFK